MAALVETLGSLVLAGALAAYVRGWWRLRRRGHAPPAWRLAAYALGVFKMSQWNMGPTEMRLLLMVGNVFLIYHSHAHVFHHRYLLYDVGGVVAIIGMSIILVVLSIQNTHTLYELERLPKQ